MSIGSLALIGNASGQTPGTERDPAQPKREVATVVEGLGQVVELGDAPPCQFCGSLMVRTVPAIGADLWQYERLLVK